MIIEEGEETEPGVIKVTFALNVQDGTMKRFFSALLEGGFEAEVRFMAVEILAEAKRRGLPIADQLELAIANAPAPQRKDE